MAKLDSLIRLAENPIEKAEDNMDYENEDEMDEKEDKGRSVHGPRTKLASMDDVTEGIANLTKAVQLLAKSQETVLSKLYNDFPPPQHGGGGAPPQQQQQQPAPPMKDPHDPMAGGFGGEDDLDLDAEFHGGAFAPYGQEEQAPMRGQDVTMQQVPMDVAGRGTLANALVAKDDAASSFGEKDSDIPGNRRLDPDNKDQSASQWLIQGGESDGPGVNKALVKAIQQIVRSEISNSRVSKSSQSPLNVPSQVNKSAEPAIDTKALMKDFSKLSFREIARARVDAGDLPAGIL